MEAKSIVILPLPQSFYSAIFSPEAEAITLHLQAINTVNLAIFMDTGSVMTSKNAFQWHHCNDSGLRRNISNPWQSQGSECGKLVKREEWESFHTIRKYWQSELNPVRGNLDDICYEEVQRKGIYPTTYKHVCPQLVNDSIFSKIFCLDCWW